MKNPVSLTLLPPDMNQEHFDKLITQQENYWCEQIENLVHNDQIDDSFALYTEYVVDERHILDDEYFYAPRIKDFWDTDSFQEIKSKLF